MTLQAIMDQKFLKEKIMNEDTSFWLFVIFLCSIGSCYRSGNAVENSEKAKEYSESAATYAKKANQTSLETAKEVKELKEIILKGDLH